MKKILFLVQLAPPIHGASTINGYIKNSTLVNSQYESHYINTISAKDLTDVQKFGWEKMMKISQLYIKIFRACFRNKYDLLFITLSTDGGAFYKSAFVWLLASLFIKKRLIMFHEKGISQTASKNILAKLLTNLITRNSSIIVTSSLLLEEFSSSKTNKFVVCSGTPGKSIQRYDEITVNRVPRLLYMSNLIIEKGILTFIDICEKLTDDKFDFEAIIIGKELDIKIEFLQRIIDEKKMTNKISIVGPKYNQDKEEYLLKSDFLIFPTSYKRETTPLVIQEAFKFGLIPISSTEGGIPDLISHGVDGFMINPENIQEYCDTIKWLTKDNRLKTFQRAGQLKFNTRFTLDVFEKNMASVLNTALVSLTN